MPVYPASHVYLVTRVHKYILYALACNHAGLWFISFAHALEVQLFCCM